MIPRVCRLDTLVCRDGTVCGGVPQPLGNFERLPDGRCGAGACVDGVDLSPGSATVCGSSRSATAHSRSGSRKRLSTSSKGFSALGFWIE